jgi:predicted enzyme related to lactoylglutathione lyase
MSAGSFIWYELMTPDPDVATTFYGAVVGWKISAPSPMPDGKDYRGILRDDGGSEGGVLKLTADMQKHGALPVWLGYLHVTDVDAAVKAIEAEGGKTLMPRMDLPVGKIAMVTDPMGTPFYVMAPIPPPGKPDAKSDVFDTTARQRVRWNELASPDLARAKTFYARHFNFQFNEVMSMGPAGDYCFIDHDGVRLGGMMQSHSVGPASWLFYFRVDSLAAAQRAIEAGGGKITRGPHEVPGNEWVIAATDPAGAAFGIVSARRD